MLPKNMRNKLPFVAIALAVASLAGCELLVDFDRTKIDGGSLDGTTPDATNDTTSDTTQPDVSNDTGNDVTVNDASDGSVNDVVTSDVIDSSTVDADDGAADADDGAADDGADE